jgi:hypothetical protein
MKNASIIADKRAQAWSIDTIVAFFVFFGALAGFLIYMGTSTDTSDIVKNDFKKLPKVLESSNSPYKLIDGNKLNTETLKEIANDNYDSVKNNLGVSSDFCIYITDSDGNLVNINELLGEPGEKYGIGNGNIKLSDSIECG